ncbi:nicotinate-nucleotide adenylyltransferase [Geosporobacter ferrireducens]|uniref:Probable nicotinate-nucleotide adenylyltransferase n=1 Tax=Geosporobacter ferrireducens TaxID=1424294 RepID=A0A1D8GK42_9FIRM|nr:nicotinate-nucleotide adenylyltransferase [Geosporobacter ferrireducens]AOT71280.1 nicotinate (nicotinamide) nucleotide adenylyltransferase [Geosporobacter ferrireducens]
MKRIGVYGGSFNPIHKGHIHAAVQFSKQLELDKVLVIPTNIPPHKKNYLLLDAKARYEMCSLASHENPVLVTDDIEIRNQGKNYTFKTLEALLEREKESEFYLLLGSDMFMCFSEWIGFKEIIKIATICSIPRDHGEMEGLMAMEKKLQSYGAKTKICTAEILPVSSTEIRMKIKQGADVSDMLHSKVYEYIEKNHLYKNQNENRIDAICG